jgi:hypothetical protein
MTYRTDELEAAARAIDSSSLQKAKAAIALNCEEYLHWLDLFQERLETVEPTELHKFARAFCLTMLGHLPTRPETCPFCIQYGWDRECLDCGYGATHGRCDEDDSAFSLFIEAFQELGRLIFQDTVTDECDCRPQETKRLLLASIQESGELASEMRRGLVSLSTLQLMEQKQIFIDRMIGCLPLGLFSDDIIEQCRLLQDRLKGYW